MNSLLLAAVLAFPVGLTLGLLGGGGSILTIPLLVYALGVDERSAIASSLVVVGATAAVAAVTHARAGNVVWPTAFLFAGAGMVGAFVGGSVARFLPASLLLVLLAVVMAVAAFFMWRGRKENRRPESSSGRMPLGKVLGQGLFVGTLTGLVGAGGGFLVVPALALLGGLPMHKAVGSSLVVIALNSLAGLAGQVSHVEVDWVLTGVFTGAAVLGSFGGAALGKHVSAERLRKAFALFVVAMALFLLGKQFEGLWKKTPSSSATTARILMFAWEGKSV